MTAPVPVWVCAPGVRRIPNLQAFLPDFDLRAVPGGVAAASSSRQSQICQGCDARFTNSKCARDALGSGAEPQPAEEEEYPYDLFRRVIYLPAGRVSSVLDNLSIETPTPGGTL